MIGGKLQNHNVIRVDGKDSEGGINGADNGMQASNRYA